MNSIVGLIERFFRLFVWWITVAPWEEAVRVRAGKHVRRLDPGLHFKVPVIDRIYLQTTRRRVSGMPVQTLTSADGVTITLAAVLGYQITDLLKLYQTLHHAESTLRNLAMAAMADFVQGHRAEDCTPGAIQAYAARNVGIERYGLGAPEVWLVMFARVRTHRFIMDSHWGTDGDNLQTTLPVQSPGAPQ